MRRLNIRNLKFFKKHSIIAQFKSLERILEWAYFLSLDKQFQRYLNFSAPKKRDGGFVEFVDKSLKGNYILRVAPTTKFLMVFRSFLGINPHNFVKNHPIFKNKGLFYAKLHQVLHEILFTLQKSSLWSLGPNN